MKVDIQPEPIDAAYALIAASLPAVPGSETLVLGEALGRVTAEVTRASMALPATDNSAVDGYGVTADDVTASSPLRVVGRLVAGDQPSPVRLVPGCAVYLATGAPVPDSVAAVVMHEHAPLSDGAITLDHPLKLHENIRRRGEDVAENDVLVPAARIIDHRHIGILAASGIDRITVRRPLRVALFATGDELAVPGQKLGPGQVYDANTPMISALLASAMVSLEVVARLPDDRGAATKALGSASHLDLIITTGGAAGSDTDHAASSIRAAGGQASALKLALRPGKPLVFGRLGQALVMGLPGNPTAAMTGFLLFVRPSLRALAGLPLVRPIGFPGIAAERLEVRPNRTEFAPAGIVGVSSDGRLVLARLGRGGSSRLRPLVEADGLLELHSARDSIEPGEPLTFHPFNAPFGASR